MRDEDRGALRGRGLIAQRDAGAPDADRERYWSLTVQIASEHVEELGARLLQLGFSAFEERAVPAGALVLVYAQSEERLREVARELLASEPLRGALSCEIGEVPSDWQLEWTQHLAPVQLTAELRIVPGTPGEAQNPKDLYLEPAFAFGFGEHPSTRLIAGWVEQACRRRPRAALLDVGCGTGVLALVAARSGAARVLGVDTSLPAVQAAARNAALNGAANVTFSHGSIERLDGTFDLIVANIEAPVLIELCRGIARRIAPAGALALSGLISEQAEDVVHAYAGAGVQLGIRAREGEWCLLASE